MTSLWSESKVNYNSKLDQVELVGMEEGGSSGDATTVTFASFEGGESRGAGGDLEKAASPTTSIDGGDFIDVGVSSSLVI